ncbi:type II toxin-antitoxin system RelE/ParE family toxin [Flavobacterium sp. ZT3R18]|uniref:type II toxin-antitoxin system RelE/ParE family toxin n=1 Tax=Flavobacterium sp. ZT3R18 TaxID=2594429 RepID=UPI001179A9C4|nr:type II toxin-antitoxin system RelE/ParE family toxin [Flavobacterium sp. ZT3R18]TRX38116.1 type II toxin-antitoxin system RelE/ParE family toxin [Flavobacterium sp. ZT3R18]
MRFQLKIDVDALNDIQETFEWYEMQLKGLGLRFKTQTKKQINSLKKNPYLFAIKYNEVRCRKIEKFPFLIHYTIEEELNIITVFAVFHTSRSPEIWKKRTK